MIRHNLGIVAHVDAGKTTVTEQLLYRAGAVLRPGSVDDGTAQTDYMAVERSRGISVRAACATLSWQGKELCLIDTPGHADFAAEVERSLRVLDCAVLVLSCVEGVQAQSELYFDALRRLKVPTILFLNKTDRAGADPERVLEEAHRRFGLPAVFLDEPQALLPVLSENDEKLAERYLMDEPVSGEELQTALARQFRAGLVLPALRGAALRGEGVDELLTAVTELAPAAGGDPAGPVAGLVFKVEHDPTLGRAAYVRLYSGRLRNRDPVENATRGGSHKAVQIRKALGRRTLDAGQMEAGEIAAVYGLSDVRAGDLLGDASLVPGGVELAAPLLRVRLLAEREEDYPALTAACEELCAEDPLLDMVWTRETRELLLSVTGLIQLEILEALLRDRFGLAVTMTEPEVIYRETPTVPATGFDAYTMPKPCWAIVEFEIEPLPPGSGVVYESRVPDTKIHYRYQGQVAQTIPEALRQGPKGWPVTDLKITMVDGSDHNIHTHPLDFATVTPMALRKGLVAAQTRLLEPMQRFRLTVPEEVGGKMISEIIRMRGTFDPAETAGDKMLLTGRVPAGETLEFPSFVARVSGGRGLLQMTFDGYDPCPPGVGKETPYRGIDPLDRDRYILWIRGAITK